MPPSGPHPGCGACVSSLPDPQQIVPGCPAQSGVPSHCQSVSPSAHIAAIGAHSDVPVDGGSQQCCVPAGQVTSMPPATALKGQ